MKYMIHIPVKAKFIDPNKDEITEGEEYETTKRENPYYILILTDEDGNEHEVKVGELPVVVTDESGNEYEVDENGNVRLVEELGDAEEGDAPKESECGCPEDLLQGSFNGDCDRILIQLKKIKTAYESEETVTLDKYYGTMPKGRMNIDSLCISDLYLDMSWVQRDTVRFEPSDYKVVQSVSQNGTKFQAIKYDDILEIKIPEKEDDAEKKIKALEKWLFGGGSNEDEGIILDEEGNWWVNQFEWF
ncbi:hypothetical protein [Viscerimonas tarda]